VSDHLLLSLHLQSHAQQLGLVFILAACGFAAWRGGRIERWGAAAMLGAWFATAFSPQLAPMLSVEQRVLAIDLALLAALAWLALRADRFWPLWATAFHLLASVLHLAAAVDPGVTTRMRVSGSYIWGYLTVLTLVAGVVLEARRRPRAG